MTFHESLSLEVLIISSVLITSILLGFIFQRKIIPRLRKRYARTQNANLRIFMTTIQGPVLIWFVLGAIYGLGRYFQLDPTSDVGEIMDTALLIIQIILYITFTYVLIQLSRNLLKFYIRKGRLPNTTIFTSISNVTITVLGVMLILISLGLNISPIVGALGIGGIAVALALQPTLANLFAGVSIIASKQLNPGDLIQLAIDEVGFIEDIQWRTTSIRTLQNNLIIVPNSMIANMKIINYTLPQKELSLPIEVGVHYDSDLDQVRDVCLDVAAFVRDTYENVVKSFDPVLRFLRFGPSSIDIRIVLRIDDYTQQFRIRSEFIRILRKRFKDEGIIIPYPITTVEFADKKVPFGDQSEFQ